MLNENIQALRKSKGLSQEELALKLNVVRQTVSKWERGLSVPDAEMPVAIGEVLDTPVSTLLGETVAASEPEGLQALSEKLEVLNDQFARAQESKRRALHALYIAIAAVAALVLIALASIGARISSGISPIRNTQWLQRCPMDSSGSSLEWHRSYWRDRSRAQLRPANKALHSFRDQFTMGTASQWAAH